MTRRFDFAIVGGGISGLVAARELSRNGFHCALFEARDRLGGRTWSVQWDGRVTEIGGQWLHWLQPHIWSEVTRYGLELYHREPITHVRWLTGGKVRSGTVGDFHDAYAKAWSALYDGAMETFPIPHQPDFNEAAVRRLDERSVGDRLAELRLSEEERDIVRSLAAVSFNAPADAGALTAGMRRLAMANGDPDLFAKMVSVYKLKQGSGALIEAMAADVTAEIHTSTEIASITVGDDGVELQSAAGDEWRADQVILALPLHKLADVQVTPPLPQALREVAEAGQMTSGRMLWVLLEDAPDHFLFMAPPEHGVIYARYDGRVGDKVLANVFWVGPDMGEVPTKDALEQSLRTWDPTIRVAEIRYHDWCRDPYSKQTWSMLRPGQLTAQLASPLNRDRLTIAGADFASGWHGFMDGAVEMGLKAARHGSQANIARKKQLSKGINQ